jgi:endoglucanase
MSAFPLLRRGFDLHEMFLELLETLREFHCGWVRLNLGGSFGVLDSTRADVAYADWHGVPLDRALLDLLRRF